MLNLSTIPRLITVANLLTRFKKIQVYMNYLYRDTCKMNIHSDIINYSNITNILSCSSYKIHENKSEEAYDMGVAEN